MKPVEKRDNEICQCGYKYKDHTTRYLDGYRYIQILCPYSLALGRNSQFRTLGGVFTYSVGFNND